MTEENIETITIIDEVLGERFLSFGDTLKKQKHKDDPGFHPYQSNPDKYRNEVQKMKNYGISPPTNIFSCPWCGFRTDTKQLLTRHLDPVEAFVD